MIASRAVLTELEGAILGVLRRDPGLTAYKIRKTFLDSISAEWSGSAGAVYPALRRMEEAGFIRASKERDGRGTKGYTLTKAGTATHDDWLCDLTQTIGPGMDPFRTRACLWPFLDARRKRSFLNELRKETERMCDRIALNKAKDDQYEAITTAMLLELLRQRLAWLERELR
jgi:DNA-binding PadR family transcriptional regulator